MECAASTGKRNFTLDVALPLHKLLLVLLDCGFRAI